MSRVMPALPECRTSGRQPDNDSHHCCFMDDWHHSAFSREQLKDNDVGQTVHWMGARQRPEWKDFIGYSLDTDYTEPGETVCVKDNTPNTNGNRLVTKGKKSRDLPRGGWKKCWRKSAETFQWAHWSLEDAWKHESLLLLAALEDRLGKQVPWQVRTQPRAALQGPTADAAVRCGTVGENCHRHLKALPREQGRELIHFDCYGLLHYAP
jgi:hypothetical protein